MNYFEHHIGDYDEATSHLTACEDGIYSRLIRKYMATERPLPVELPALQRLVRARSKEEKSAVKAMLEEFFELREDGWHNRRCDEELAKFHDKSAKAKRSAAVRWDAQRSHSGRNANASGDADAGAMRTHSEGNATREHAQAPAPARPQAPLPTTQTSEGKPSDAGASAGRPASDQPKTELWRSAVSLLAGQGMPELQARSFIGKLAKDYPDGDIVLDAVRGAVGEQPADARAYLKATCQRLAGERQSRPRGGAASDWTATAT